MEIHSIRTPGLGDTTYLLVHDGVVVVVDPQRDTDRFDEVVEKVDGEVRYVLETHVHNDYVSGGRDLARKWGAELVFPAGAAPVFRHLPAFHHEDLQAGSLTIRPIHTPGHTPEHTSYLAVIDGIETAVFSGGSLLTGSAGRTDLLGPERAETLARLQYGSVHRLGRLPDDTRLCPTHGAGSFCSASPAGRYESTIGEERASNPVLAHPDEESFVAAQLSGLPAYPTYYRYMAPINLSGTLASPDLSAPDLTASELHGMTGEVTVIDCRPTRDFAAGHIPRSLSVELTRSFGVWVGWLVEFDTPLVLVMSPDQDKEEAIRQLARIGFDQVWGVARDLATWPEDLSTIGVTDVAGFVDAIEDGAQIVDTRAPAEWEQGAIGGSHLIYVPEFISGAADSLDPTRPVWVICESGFRAGIASSLLAAEGHRPIALLQAGVTEVLSAMSDNG